MPNYTEPPEYKECTSNNKRHREDVPTVKWSSGTKCWLMNGEYHRECGPAIESQSGYKAWYLNDILYSKKEYFGELEKLLGKTHANKIRLIYA